ncbi:MAG: four-carbon acid sugar kinase family protein [Parafilimonas terrae]|nr:four-carbon acid sugar kinase family protein [Parafilimonas terrae]
MARHWLILADDLTGAADCAIAFAKRGLHTTVRWRGEPEAADEAVLSYDANSRGLQAPEAASRHAAVIAALHRPGTRVFKKIDSTLRGQPMAELAATLSHFRAQTGAAFGILAPAFPGTGRTTEDGRIIVHGQPLEETETWRRDHTYPTGDLAAVLLGTGIAAEVIALDTVRADTGRLRAALAAAAERAEVAICDAANDDDLVRIAHATHAAGEPPLSPGLFWIGSGGLADALAQVSETPSSAPPPLGRPAGGTLVVVGSLAALSRQAARTLAADPAIRHVPVDPAFAFADETIVARTAETIAGSLRAGEDVLVELMMGGAPDLSQGPAFADALGRLLAPATRHMGGLAATGGETSAAILAHCGVDGLRLVDEIEPGISLGLTLGSITVPIVTKAGAFGDEGSLLRAVHRLRAVYTKGSIA